jgi:hypothetical protein
VALFWRRYDRAMSRRTAPTASQELRAAFDWLSIMRELLSFLSLAR